MTRPLFIVLILLATSLAAAPADAQQAYISTVRSDACRPGETAPCSRAMIETVNAADGQTLRSVDIWRNLGRAVAIAVHPSGERLYAMSYVAASATPQNTVFQVFSTESWAEVAAFTVAGTGRRLAFSSDGSRLFVVRTELSDVAVIDSASGQVVSAIAAVQPRDVIVGRDGTVYVAHGDKRVTLHDPSTNAVRRTISLPAAIFGLTLSTGNTRLYGVLASGVAEIDLTTGLVAVITDVGGAYPQAVAYARGQLYVTVASGTPGLGYESISVIDPVSHTLVARIGVVEPFLVAASPDETRVVATTADRWLSVNTSTNTVSATVGVPPWGTGFAASVAFAAPSPFRDVTIDSPHAGAIAEQPFSMSGWAVDVRGLSGEPGIDAIHVWAQPVAGGAPAFVGSALYGEPRAGVAALFGPRYLNSGYSVTVRGLPPGAYDLTAYAHSSRTQSFVVARSTRIQVTARVLIAVDAPAASSEVLPSTLIAGWALDTGSPHGSGVDAVHVWGYRGDTGAPFFVGAATLGQARPDVAAVYGPQFSTAGFSLAATGLPSGRHTFVVYARRASTGVFAATHTFAVAVIAHRLLTVVDAPQAYAVLPGYFAIAGWAIELGAGAGTGISEVHVWARRDGTDTATFLGSAAYGWPRPDVAAVYGQQYLGAGFNLGGTLPPGTYLLLVYARSASSQSFSTPAQVPVTVGAR